MKNNVMAKRIAVTLLSGALAFSSVMPVAAAHPNQGKGDATDNSYYVLTTGGVVTGGAANRTVTAGETARKVTTYTISLKNARQKNANRSKRCVLVPGVKYEITAKCVQADGDTNKDMNLDLDGATVKLSDRAAAHIEWNNGTPYVVADKYGLTYNKDKTKNTSFTVTVTLPADASGENLETQTVKDIETDKLSSSTIKEGLEGLDDNADNTPNNNNIIDRREVDAANANSQTLAYNYVKGLISDLYGDTLTDSNVTIRSFTAADTKKTGSFTADVSAKVTDGTNTESGSARLNFVIKKVETASKFTDVSSSAYYADPVSWAVSQKITTGTSNTTFDPSADVTRVQFVVFLYRYSNEKISTPASSEFTDVSGLKDEEKQAIAWAVSKKITTGTSDTTFSPKDTVTRAQAATFLYRARKAIYNDVAVSGTNKFTDLKDGAYYIDAVNWGVNYKLNHGVVINGTSATTFAPSANTTRAQAVTFIYRAFAD